MSYFCKKGLKTMPVIDILEKRIQYRIKKSKDSVFMLPDFLDLSDRDQVMRALRKLIKSGLILKVGQGVYVKAEKSIINGDLIPTINLTEIGKIVAKNLKLKLFSTNMSYGIMKAKQLKFQQDMLFLCLEELTEE